MFVKKYSDGNFSSDDFFNNPLKIMLGRKQYDEALKTQPSENISKANNKLQ